MSRQSHWNQVEFVVVSVSLYLPPWRTIPSSRSHVRQLWCDSKVLPEFQWKGTFHEEEFYSNTLWGFCCLVFSFRSFLHMYHVSYALNEIAAIKGNHCCYNKSSLWTTHSTQAILQRSSESFDFKVRVSKSGTCLKFLLHLCPFQLHRNRSSQHLPWLFLFCLDWPSSLLLLFVFETLWRSPRRPHDLERTWKSIQAYASVPGAPRKMLWKFTPGWTQKNKVHPIKPQTISIILTQSFQHFQQHAFKKAPLVVSHWSGEAAAFYRFVWQLIRWSQEKETQKFAPKSPRWQRHVHQASLRKKLLC